MSRASMQTSTPNANGSKLVRAKKCVKQGLRVHLPAKAFRESAKTAKKPKRKTRRA